MGLLRAVEQLQQLEVNQLGLVLQILELRATSILQLDNHPQYIWNSMVVICKLA